MPDPATIWGGIKAGLSVADWISGMDDQGKAIEAAKDLQRESQDFEAAEAERARHHQAAEAARQRNYERERRARYERLYQGFVNRQRQVRYDWEKSRGAFLRGGQAFMTPGRRGALDAQIAESDRSAAGQKERLNESILPGGYPELDAKMEDAPPIGPAPAAHVPHSERGGRVVRGTGYTRGQDTPVVNDGRVAVPRGGITVPQEAVVDPGMGTAAVLSRPPAAAPGALPAGVQHGFVPPAPIWEGANPGGGPRTVLDMIDPRGDPRIIID